MKWYYYLHTNGDLIGKNPVAMDSDPEYFNSDFVKKVWLIDTTERLDVWTLVLEALAVGTSKSQVGELINKWDLTPKDLKMFLIQAKPTSTLKRGIDIYLEEYHNMTLQDEFFDNFKED
jgi:hypothetical protein